MQLFWNGFEAPIYIYLTPQNKKTCAPEIFCHFKRKNRRKPSFFLRIMSVLGGCWISPANMDVSENSGTPKSSILIGFSIINHPFWGTPIFGNPHIVPGQSIFPSCRLFFAFGPGAACTPRGLGRPEVYKSQAGLEYPMQYPWDDCIFTIIYLQWLVDFCGKWVGKSTIHTWILLVLCSWCPFLLSHFCKRLVFCWMCFAPVFLYSFLQGLFGGALVKKALNLMLSCL